MKARIATLTAVSAIALLALSAPARIHGQQPNEHDQHHAAPAQTAASERPDMTQMMAAMHAGDQKLDDLTKKMNAATGQAKIDAMAELLTALVQDRRAMHESMGNMPMMHMGGMGTGGTAPAQK